MSPDSDREEAQGNTPQIFMEHRAPDYTVAS